MRNKLLLAFASLLIFFVLFVRVQFNNKLKIFKEALSKFEIEQAEQFRLKKESRLAFFKNLNSSLFDNFKNQFDENLAYVENDTSFSYLYLTERVNYRIPSLKYIDCLEFHCYVREKNKTSMSLILAKEEELGNKYGETFTTWYSKLRDDKIIKKEPLEGDCHYFFSDTYEIVFDENVWNEFDRFLLTINTETNEADIESRHAENQFNARVSATRNQLNSSALDYFDGLIKDRKNQILRSVSTEKVFNSPLLGLITYLINNQTFEEDQYENIANNALEEQWKYNSLYTGSMPYANCFGASNFCSGFECSKITVKTGLGSDVLVSIKDIYGDVVRHGYIKAGNTFSFNVPDGQYQVFFYSGSGWNPNKPMNSNSCTSLRGGFVAGEEVTKDNFISLVSQQMTYELILQSNGNLSTQPSSKSQAF